MANKFFNIFNYKSALILGILLTLGGGQNQQLFIPGISLFLGALIYKSAKNRKTGVAKPSIIKQILEIAALLILYILAILEGLEFIVENPAASIMGPCLVATIYIATIFREKFNFGDNKTKRYLVIAGLFIIITIVSIFVVASIAPK